MFGVVSALLFESPRRVFGGIWRTVALLGCISLVAACSDGYPVEDAPLLSSSEMSTDQLLITMNAVGKKTHHPYRRRYALEPGCVLEVKVRRPGLSPQTMLVPLDGADIEMAPGSTDETFNIQLKPSGNTPTKVPVLEGGKWADAIQMRSLLMHLQRNCHITTTS